MSTQKVQKASLFTLEQVKTMLLEKVYKHAMHDLNVALKKKILNHEYCTTPVRGAFYRKRYYLRNDIFHPTYFPDGTIERRHKRPKWPKQVKNS